MHRITFTLFALTALILSGCDEGEVPETEEIVRGLKTFVVSEAQDSTLRRFPSVLEPSEVSTLSFEIGGAIQEVDLRIGQLVQRGDVLATLDSRTLEIGLDNAKAAVERTQSEYRNAQIALKRQQNLFEREFTTKAALEAAETEAVARKSALEQAKAAVDSAKTDLTKTTLVAPFSGTINSIEATSFSTVSAGAPVASMYQNDAFEVSFSVNFEIAGRVVVGTPATVKLADLPKVNLKAVISEIGSRADTVSAFPVVVTLIDSDPVLKAGMAVEVSLEFPLPKSEGYLIPLTTVSTDLSTINRVENPTSDTLVTFVFDEAEGVVHKRDVAVAGIRDNSLIVISGLEPGEHVASAGVSFLRDGQKVKLLSEGSKD